MPLPFLVAAGIAVVGAGVGAVANEVRRRENDKDSLADEIEPIMRNGDYWNVVLELRDKNNEVVGTYNQNSR